MQLQREKYVADRDLESLVEFAMGRIDVVVHRLNNKNYETVMANVKGRWLIDFCDEHESRCLTSLSRRKLAASLRNLVNVGFIVCSGESETLCSKLERESGVVFFDEAPTSSSATSSVRCELAVNNMCHFTMNIIMIYVWLQAIDSLEALEIADKVLRLLPSISDINEDKLKAILIWLCFIVYACFISSLHINMFVLYI